MLPGDPLKDVGGVMADLGGVPKVGMPFPFPVGEDPKGGGEAGEAGPPLEEPGPGGLIRFSF